MIREEFEIKLVEEAKAWIGTPFLHNGRSRSQGVDCMGLIYVIYKNLGFDVPDGDGQSYSFDWFHHTPESRYMAGLLKLGKSVEKNDIRIGDILMFRPGLIAPSRNNKITHGGVCVGNNEMIHARNGAPVEITKLSYKAWDITFAGAIRLHIVADMPM